MVRTKDFYGEMFLWLVPLHIIPLLGAMLRESELWLVADANIHLGVIDAGDLIYISSCWSMLAAASAGGAFPAGNRSSSRSSRSSRSRSSSR